MDSRAPRIQPSVLREDRIAARLARVMYRYRDCHQIERLIIHSDGGIDIRFRDPRPDHAHSSRSAVAHVGSEGGRKLVYASLWPFLEFKNDFQEKRKS